MATMSGDGQQRRGRGEVSGSTASRGTLLAEFSLDSPLLRQTLQHTPGVRIDVEQELALDDTDTLLTIKAVGDDSTDFKAFERALDADETVSYVDRLGVESETERRYQLSVPRGYSPYWKWAQQGMVLMNATRRPDEWEFRMRIPTREDLVEFREYCREQGWRFTLTQLRQYAPTGKSRAQNRATTKQRELLDAAVDQGYFAVPRGVSLSELAEEFDISDQAASERLRRGLSNNLGSV